MLEELVRTLLREKAEASLHGHNESSPTITEGNKFLTESEGAPLHDVYLLSRVFTERIGVEVVHKIVAAAVLVGERREVIYGICMYFALH
jgi:hypothetical protein